MRLIYLIRLISLFLSPIFPVPAKRIYFTTNGLSSGTPINPGYSFNYFWSGSGMGANGNIYFAASTNSETQGGGDVVVGEYNPYTNQMKGLGTVIRGYMLAQNRYANEYCNKMHTWMHGTPDGKVWFGTEDGGRGGHLMYVETATGKLIDYARTQKFIYTDNIFAPVLNQPSQPIGPNNGVSIKDYSFKISGANPKNPRYLWTEAYGGYYFHVWDLQTDSTRGWRGGHRDLRAFLVGPDGSLYYMDGWSGTCMKRTITGQLATVGSGLSSAPPASYCYTESGDTGYTITRITGQVVQIDFASDRARLLADLPDGSGNNDHRCIVASRDGKNLYVMGNDNIYEVNTVTGSHTNLGGLGGATGSFYAMSSGLRDSLGNFYITVNDNGNGNSYLLQVQLGKDKITWSHPGTGTENSGPLVAISGALTISPNPFSMHTRFTLDSWFTKQMENGASLRVINMMGQIVRDFSLDSENFGNGFSWSPRNLPPGTYTVHVKTGNRSVAKKAVLVR
jgi:hypothetical protein